jgi:1-acyl-sn-glycerol-3-phosphate acyltransferase
MSLDIENAPSGAGSRSGRGGRLGWALLNVLQTVAMAVWSVVWISLSMVVMVLTLRRDMPLVMARRIWAPGMLRIAGAKLVVEGSRVDWSKPHIFVMNHQSALDIPSAFVALRANLRFIAKKELAWVPFLGWYMLATGMIFVDRGKRASATRSLQRAGKKIRDGASIIAYPEGTRSRDGYVRPFKKGVFAVALEAGVPIVPVAVQGSRDVLPSNRFSMRPGTIHVRIGEPVETPPYRDGGRDALLERVHASIVQENVKLGGLGAVPASLK